MRWLFVRKILAATLHQAFYGIRKSAELAMKLLHLGVLLDDHLIEFFQLSLLKGKLLFQGNEAFFRILMAHDLERKRFRDSPQSPCRERHPVGLTRASTWVDNGHRYR